MVSPLFRRHGAATKSSRSSTPTTETTNVAPSATIRQDIPSHVAAPPSTSKSSQSPKPKKRPRPRRFMSFQPFAPIMPGPARDEDYLPPSPPSTATTGTLTSSTESSLPSPVEIMTGKRRPKWKRYNQAWIDEWEMDFNDSDYLEEEEQVDEDEDEEESQPSTSVALPRRKRKRRRVIRSKDKDSAYVDREESEEDEQESHPAILDVTPRKRRKGTKRTNRGKDPEYVDSEDEVEDEEGQPSSSAATRRRGSKRSRTTARRKGALKKTKKAQKDGGEAPVANKNVSFNNPLDDDGIRETVQHRQSLLPSQRTRPATRAAAVGRGTRSSPRNFGLPTPSPTPPSSPYTADDEETSSSSPYPSPPVPVLVSNAPSGTARGGKRRPGRTPPHPSSTSRPKTRQAARQPRHSILSAPQSRQSSSRSGLTGTTVVAETATATGTMGRRSKPRSPSPFHETPTTKTPSLVSPDWAKLAERQQQEDEAQKMQELGLERESEQIIDQQPRLRPRKRTPPSKIGRVREGHGLPTPPSTNGAKWRKKQIPDECEGALSTWSETDAVTAAGIQAASAPSLPPRPTPFRLNLPTVSPASCPSPTLTTLPNPRPLGPDEASRHFATLTSLIRTLSTTYCASPPPSPSSPHATNLLLHRLASTAPHHLLSYIQHVVDGSQYGWSTLLRSIDSRAFLLQAVVARALHEHVFSPACFGVAADEARWLDQCDVHALSADGDGDAFARTIARAERISTLSEKRADGLPGRFGEEVEGLVERVARLVEPLLGEGADVERFVADLRQIVMFAGMLAVGLRLSALHRRFPGSFFEFVFPTKGDWYDETVLRCVNTDFVKRTAHHAWAGAEGTLGSSTWGQEVGGRQRLSALARRRVEIVGWPSVVWHVPGKVGEQRQEQYKSLKDTMEKEGFTSKVVYKAEVWVENTPEAFGWYGLKEKYTGESLKRLFGRKETLRTGSSLYYKNVSVWAKLLLRSTVLAAAVGGLAYYSSPVARATLEKGMHTVLGSPRVAKRAWSTALAGTFAAPGQLAGRISGAVEKILADVAKRGEQLKSQTNHLLQPGFDVRLKDALRADYEDMKGKLYGKAQWVEATVQEQKAATIARQAVSKPYRFSALRNAFASVTSPFSSTISQPLAGNGAAPPPRASPLGLKTTDAGRRNSFRITKMTEF